VARSVFERQMRALAEAGWRTLTLAQFADAVRYPRPTPDAPRPLRYPRPTPDARRPFLLTFDDGYASLAEHAFPVLADLGFTATTFLITDYVGKTNGWDVCYTWRPLAHLSWETVDAWAGRGFDFGSHGAAHRRLTWLGDAAVADELGRSRDALGRRLGAGAARAVAYPFGAVDQRVAGLARAAGYALGFGGVRGDGAGLTLSRVPVYAWDVASVPFGLRADRLGAVGRLVAHVANRCAVGTSVIKGLGAWGEGLGGSSCSPSP
jgi:peptidoglycan/xylan/chitin deacetylase (PgdA/CDA1 family)